jgi:hypothetical protein
VNGWHDYYHVIGDAAAALMGLLFVSLSLNADVIAHKANADLRALAAQTFTNFICLILFALLFEIPDQGPLGLGLPMLGIDLLLLYITARHILDARRRRSQRWGRGILAFRLILPIFCLVTVLAIAITVLLGISDELYWFVPVTILLLVNASLNAWDLLLRLRKQENE